MVIRTTVYTDTKDIKHDGVHVDIFKDEDEADLEAVTRILGYFSVHGPDIMENAKERLATAIATKDWTTYYKLLQKACKKMAKECKRVKVDAAFTEIL